MLRRTQNYLYLSRLLTHKHINLCSQHFNINSVIKWQKYSTSSDSGSKNSSKAVTTSALSGIKVLDLTRVLAGPYCTMILGDLGAEVFKIEKPGTGDDTRQWGPPFVGSESCYYLCVNRNKKSITLDLKSPDGIKIIKKLASVSDVLVENYIPGKLSQMGIGYEQLSAECPHLIYCSISGYGQTGSYSQRAGYDVIASGMGGLMHITGPNEGEPCKVGVAITDLSTGLYAVSSILASLFVRQKTGKGQHIDCNLLSTNVASLVNVASNYLNAEVEGNRYGTAHASIVPYQAFRTKNGYLIVGAGNDSQFQILIKLMNLSAMNDERFSTNQGRVKHRASLLNLLNAEFGERTTEEWCEIFEGSGIPYGPINNIEGVFNDPQVQHNGMIQEIPHTTLGSVRVPGPAVRYSETPTVTPTAPPLLGQHTTEVLAETLGYSKQQIAQLQLDGVIS